MATEASNKGRTLHFSISLDDETVSDKRIQAEDQKEATRPLIVDEAHLLEIANLTIVEGKKKTEHGLTLVKLVEFRQETHRQKIIQMVDASFRSVIWNTLPYYFLLGAHPNAAIRQRTAEMIGELMCQIDFDRIKNEVVKPWAMTDNLYMNSCVGMSLKCAAQDEKYQGNVKSLLKHWISSDSPSLNWTAAASCGRLASTWPQFSLDLLEIALGKVEEDRVDLLILIIFAMRELCQTGSSDLVLERIFGWINKPKISAIYKQSIILVFLDIFQLSNIPDNDQSIDRVVGFLLMGMSDLELPDFKEIQESTLDKIYFWGKSYAESSTQTRKVEKIFSGLYITKKSEREQKRIIFNYQRWARADQNVKRLIQLAAPQSLDGA